jgi:hypothetical protein
VNGIVDEALDEATGRSSKRWGLVLLALVVGGVVAWCLARRAREGPLEELGEAASVGDSGPGTD